MRKSVILLCVAQTVVGAWGCASVEDPSASSTVGSEQVGQTTDAIKESKTFDVQFSGCTEFAGIGLVPYANARPLVPAQFTLAGDTTNSVIVVRVADCSGVIVDGHDVGAGTVSQIGLTIVAPDGTGDINNYTVWYDTTSEYLAKRLKKSGVNARHAPELDYDYTPNGDGTGNLSIESDRQPRYTVGGAVIEPTAAPVPFEANWFKASYSSTTKMDTPIAAIQFGQITSVLHTKAHSDLGKLIGGSSLTFPVLDSYNTFPAATMHVTDTAN